MVSNNLLDANTLSFCVGILHKLATDSKYLSSINDFTAITLMDKLPNYLRLDLEDKYTETLEKILHLISLVIKKN